MFDSKKRGDAATAIHTLLGKGTLWTGEFQMGANSLRIEGTVEGTIHSDGEITVAPTGHVNGTINAKHLIVTGRVDGVFHIDQCLEIHGTGWVEGEVEVGALVVDEGGTLQGTCRRKGHPLEKVSLPGTAVSAAAKSPAPPREIPAEDPGALGLDLKGDAPAPEPLPELAPQGASPKRHEARAKR